jgi:hypothetical protein
VRVQQTKSIGPLYQLTPKWLRQVLSVALTTTSLMAIATIASGDPRALSLTVSLGFPLALIIATSFQGTRHSPSLSRTIARVDTRVSDPALLAAFALCLALTSLGFYLSNRFLTDEVLGPHTRIGYLITVIGTGLLVSGETRLLRRFFLAGAKKIPRWLALAIVLGFVGLLTVFMDIRVMPGRFPKVHITAFLLSILAFATASALSTPHLHRRWIIAALLLDITCVMAPLMPRLGLDARLTDTPWAGHWQLFQTFNGLFDHDHDGYGRMFGDDCDDNDARIYPLSHEGRDCLGWVPALPPKIRKTVNPPPGPGPSIVVLITIDAFRCGFGVDDRPELRDACPHLAEMARQGRSRIQAHTVAPNTYHAMAGIHLGDRVNGQPVAALLGASGYRTHAILTHQVLINPLSGMTSGPCAASACRIRDSFQSIDDSLIERTSVPSSSTAAEVTDRGIAWLATASATPQKLFLWMHYYDPHAPYVSRPGALFIGSQIESYAAEIRRTDEEIDRFVRAIALLPRSNETLLVVTADHGEEFGRHGRERHGMTLYEQAVRVPFITWSPGRDANRFIKSPLPFSLVEFRPFLMSLLGGPAFEPATQSFFFTMYEEDPQVGILSGNWKLIRHTRLNFTELYDLTSDPMELDNRAAVETARVFDLGSRLGIELVNNEALRDGMRM